MDERDWFFDLIIDAKDEWGGYWFPLVIIAASWAVFIGLMIAANLLMAWQAGYSALPSILLTILVGVIFLPIFLVKTYKVAREYEKTKDQPAADAANSVVMASQKSNVDDGEQEGGKPSVVLRRAILKSIRENDEY